MPVTVSSEIAAQFSQFGNTASPIDEAHTAGIKIASVPPGRLFTPDERLGVVAELEAWRFQRTRAEERRTWDMYWSTLSGWTNLDGNAGDS